MLDTPPGLPRSLPPWAAKAWEGGRVLWEYRVVEQRYDAVMEVVRDGRTVTEVAERWGVSRQSLYAWMDRYAAGGLEGWPTARIVLAAAPSGPRRGGGADM